MSEKTARAEAVDQINKIDGAFLDGTGRALRAIAWALLDNADAIRSTAPTQSPCDHGCGCPPGNRCPPV